MTDCKLRILLNKVRHLRTGMGRTYNVKVVNASTTWRVQELPLNI